MSESTDPRIAWHVQQTEASIAESERKATPLPPAMLAQIQAFRASYGDERADRLEASLKSNAPPGGWITRVGATTAVSTPEHREEHEIERLIALHKPQNPDTWRAVGKRRGSEELGKVLAERYPVKAKGEGTSAVQAYGFGYARGDNARGEGR